MMSTLSSFVASDSGRVSKQPQVKSKQLPAGPRDNIEALASGSLSAGPSDDDIVSNTVYVRDEVGDCHVHIGDIKEKYNDDARSYNVVWLAPGLGQFKVISYKITILNSTPLPILMRMQIPAAYPTDMQSIKCWLPVSKFKTKRRSRRQTGLVDQFFGIPVAPGKRLTRTCRVPNTNDMRPRLVDRDGQMGVHLISFVPLVQQNVSAGGVDLKRLRPDAGNIVITISVRSATGLSREIKRQALSIDSIIGFRYLDVHDPHPVMDIPLEDILVNGRPTYNASWGAVDNLKPDQWRMTFYSKKKVDGKKVWDKTTDPYGLDKGRMYLLPVGVHHEGGGGFYAQQKVIAWISSADPMGGGIAGWGLGNIKRSDDASKPDTFILVIPSQKVDDEMLINAGEALRPLRLYVDDSRLQMDFTPEYTRGKNGKVYPLVSAPSVSSSVKSLTHIEREYQAGFADLFTVLLLCRVVVRNVLSGMDFAINALDQLLTAPPVINEHTRQAGEIIEE